MIATTAVYPRGGRVRRLAFLACVTVLVLGVGTVRAAAAQGEHFVDVGSETDLDFCGTGVAIDMSWNIRVNVWLLPGSEEFSRITQSGKVSFMNPLTGRTVELMFAGLTENVIMSGDPEGVHTHVFTTKGLPEKIKLPGGQVLLRDAGLIVETITFDENGDVLDYSATWNGPHPEAESDFQAFCEVTTTALGIA
jgi:hypothetical protein